jgi:hypothetical protein
MMPDRPGDTASTSRGPVFELLGIIALMLIVPVSVRVAFRSGEADATRVPYLSVFEGHRAGAFHAHRLPELQRMNPGYVVIGDSMAGTRINERVLSELAGMPVAPLLQAGTGPAFWYLALKNWVIASGIKPRVVFIFFRDTNLTDTMFRLDEQFRWSLDMVAGEREDELNDVVASTLQGPFHAVHDAVERVYGGDRARRVVEPALTRAPVTWITSSRRRQAELLTYANARFGLEHLRVMEAADMAADAGTDFQQAVNQSVLPLMLRDARRHGVTLCFVRVQRRPIGGQPPPQSSALRRYVGDLRDYLEARGAAFHDDTGDPAMTLDMYGDGDHIARHARDRYTTMFFERLRPLFTAAPLPAGMHSTR